MNFLWPRVTAFLFAVYPREFQLSLTPFRNDLFLAVVSNGEHTELDVKRPA